MGVFDLHHPLAFTFGILGNMISIFVYFAPLPTFIRIYKEKSTLGFQSVPYVVALFSAMLWMYYALLKTINDALLLISINCFGCLIETIYIFIFLLYAADKAKKETGKLLSCLNLGLFCVIFLLTYFPLEASLRVQVVGWICVAVSTAVFAAPLSIVFQVMRTKSVEFMPFTLSFALTLSAVMWFGYGLLQKDLCVALPNVLGFFLGMLQMLLYAIYRNPKEEAAGLQLVVDDNKKLPIQQHPVIMDIPSSTHHHKGDDNHLAMITGENSKHQQEDDEEEEEKNKNEEPSRGCQPPNNILQIDLPTPPPVLVVTCAA